MKDNQPVGPKTAKSPDVLAGDDRWQLALRIASSPLFAKAGQLREMLLYVTRRRLLDENVTIPEQEIACSALGRREDFNPSVDNIVRVQMSHLRNKLEDYFAAAGDTEPVQLRIPKGSYVPRFRRRAIESAQEVPLAPTVDSDPDTPPEPGFPTKMRTAYHWSRLQGRVIWIGAAAAIILLVALGLTRLKWPSLSVGATGHKPPRNPIADKIFVSDQPVSIVVADMNLVFLQVQLKTDISIADYISRDYPDNILRSVSDRQLREVLKELAGRRYTTLGDVNVATRCAEFGGKSGAKTTIRYARNMNARDFEQGNFILIGSRIADPWVSLFERQLNFSFEEDPTTRKFHFRNKHPLPGEQEFYMPELGDDTSVTSYVDVALIPNLSKTGYVLLLDGATQDANEAAVRLALNDELPAALSRVIAPENKGNADGPSFEIFLRDHAVSGAVSSFDVLSVRKLN